MKPGSAGRSRPRWLVLALVAAVLVVAPAAAGSVLLLGHRKAVAGPARPAGAGVPDSPAPPSPAVDPSVSPEQETSVSQPPGASATDTPSPSPSPLAAQEPPESDPQGPAPEGTPEARESDAIPQAGVLFVGGGQTDAHDCSGSVVHTAAGDVVLTAAHCVLDGGEVMPYIAFAPGYADGKEPLGLWSPPDTAHVLVPQQYRDDRDPLYDYAFVVVAPNDGKTLESVTGPGFTLDFAAVPPIRVTLTGYAAGSGGVALACTGAMGVGGVPDGFERFPCLGLPGGTSGSPWVAAGTGEQVGLTGGYDGGGDSSDFDNYSVRFGPAMRQLFEQAAAL